MIKRAFIFSLVIAIFSCSMNPAIAAQKKKSNGIIKKAVIAYIAYKVYDHYSEKKEDKAKGKSLKKSTLSQSIMMSVNMKTNARKNKGRFPALVGLSCFHSF